MVAGAQHSHQGRDGGHAGGKGVRAVAALERRQRGFKGIARGIAGARVVPATVGADAGELEGGGQIQGNVDGARLRIGFLACMYSKGRVAIVSHVGVLWEAPAFQNIATGWGGLGSSYFLASGATSSWPCFNNIPGLPM